MARSRADFFPDGVVALAVHFIDNRQQWGGVMGYLIFCEQQHWVVTFNLCVTIYTALLATMKPGAGRGLSGFVTFIRYSGEVDFYDNSLNRVYRHSITVC